MAKEIISEQSIPISTPALDLFSVPQSHVSISEHRWREVPLAHPLTDNGPFTFRIFNSKSYLDFSQNYIYGKFRIVKNDGSVVDDNVVVAPIQYFGKTFFSQIKFSVNGEVVEDTGPDYAYRAFMESELTHDDSVKRSLLRESIYAPSTGLLGTLNDIGHQQRSQMCVKSKVNEFVAPLHLSICKQERLFINFVDLVITLYRNDDAFCLQQYNSADTERYRVQLTDLRFFVKECDLWDSAVVALDKTLASGHPIHYPLNSVQMRTFHIDGGRFKSPTNVLFTTHVPRKVIVGLVDADAYNGKLNLDPFKFITASLADLRLEAGGKLFPSIRYQLDYTDNICMRAYHDFQNTLGFQGRNKTNGITFDMFKDGFCFYAFDVSPSASSDVFDVITKGTTSLLLEFKDKVPANGLFCIVYAEFQNILTIDSDRRCILDSVV